MDDEEESFRLFQNQEIFGNLRFYLLEVMKNLLSANESIRERATHEYKVIKIKSGVPFILLFFIIDQSLNDENISVMSAVLFKNIVVETWNKEPGDQKFISLEDRNSIRNFTIKILTHEINTKIRDLLLPALLHMATSDYPFYWENCLSQLTNLMFSLNSSKGVPFFFVLKELLLRYKGSDIFQAYDACFCLIQEKMPSFLEPCQGLPNIEVLQYLSELIKNFAETPVHSNNIIKKPYVEKHISFFLKLVIQSQHMYTVKLELLQFYTNIYELLYVIIIYYPCFLREHMTDITKNIRITCQWLTSLYSDGIIVVNDDMDFSISKALKIVLFCLKCLLQHYTTYDELKMDFMFIFNTGNVFAPIKLDLDVFQDIKFVKRFLYPQDNQEVMKILTLPYTMKLRVVPSHQGEFSFARSFDTFEICHYSIRNILACIYSLFEKQAKSTFCNEFHSFICTILSKENTNLYKLEASHWMVIQYLLLVSSDFSGTEKFCTDYISLCQQHLLMYDWQLSGRIISNLVNLLQMAPFSQLQDIIYSSLLLSIQSGNRCLQFATSINICRIVGFGVDSEFQLWELLLNNIVNCLNMDDNGVAYYFDAINSFLINGNKYNCTSLIQLVFESSKNFYADASVQKKLLLITTNLFKNDYYRNEIGLLANDLTLGYLKGIYLDERALHFVFLFQVLELICKFLIIKVEYIDEYFYMIVRYAQFHDTEICQAIINCLSFFFWNYYNFLVHIKDGNNNSAIENIIKILHDYTDMDITSQSDHDSYVLNLSYKTEAIYYLFNSIIRKMPDAIKRTDMLSFSMLLMKYCRSSSEWPLLYCTIRIFVLLFETNIAYMIEFLGDLPDIKGNISLVNVIRSIAKYIDRFDHDDEKERSYIVLANILDYSLSICDDVICSMPTKSLIFKNVKQCTLAQTIAGVIILKNMSLYNDRILKREGKTEYDFTSCGAYEYYQEWLEVKKEIKHQEPKFAAFKESSTLNFKEWLHFYLQQRQNITIFMEARQLLLS